jgi:LacI family gluconate utilization system Gnt-I transcriptional repressor
MYYWGLIMAKPTLIDVAQEAGVSAITVSRALRTPEKVSDSKLKKVNDAVKKLGYLPNLSASTLASSQTNSVVVMIPSVSNHVFVNVLRGIELAFKDTKLTIQIGNTGYDPLEEERMLRSALNPAPAGVILTGFEQTEIAQELLKNISAPIVQIMDVDHEPIEIGIGFSHEAASRSATKHLIAAGYKHIGFVGAQMDPRSQKRLAGYRAAIRQSEQGDERIATTNEPSDVKMGSVLFSKLVSSYPTCDAVVCNNDDLALGVLFECQRRGIRVPEDFGICGFNDLGVTSQTVPSITSVATPLFQIGYEAGKAILAKQDGVSDTNIDLGFEIVSRESTLSRS